MFHITHTLRQKLHCNLKAASNFSGTTIKVLAAAPIHNIKLIELHDTLHATKEPALKFHGLRLHDAPPTPMPTSVTLTAKTSFSNKRSAASQSQRPMEFRSINPPGTSSIAGAAKQTISALISQSAEAQINKIRRSRGRYQDKYLYSNSVPKIAKTVDAKPMSTATSAAVSKMGKDVSSIFGNKVKKAQQTLSIEDLADAFDL
ncbi:hypothetical protein DL95DRAFT_524935 [Leptodontidium sp. 2 PMI_412]|nr:hypothetical protein DL95DRAFT_524935 [Leptodontidium sp. 2 PMI_412]